MQNSIRRYSQQENKDSIDFASSLKDIGEVFIKDLSERLTGNHMKDCAPVFLSILLCFMRIYGTILTLLDC